MRSKEASRAVTLPAIVCRDLPIVLLLATAVALLGTASAGADSAQPRRFGYDIPVQSTSPWPEMRHDRHNTGASPVVGRYHGGRPWAFKTGKGIFSTPIIDGDGTVYVGSADTNFYAIRPDGKLRWRFKTGGVIDSAGVIGRYDRLHHTNPITFGSGDEFLYHVRSNPGDLSHARRVIWRLKARQPPGAGQLVDWWEGNAELGPDGTIYAGNTGDAAYAVNPDGSVKWIHRSTGSYWTDAAIGDDGTTYWGSLDLFIHALDSNGEDVWRDPTLGFVISSPALGPDGTLYVGSFDGKLYAIDAKTGLVRWTYATGDNVYSSPALDEDARGNVKRIVFASTDGSVYAVDPSGKLLWRYDTGDPVRSSPVIGRLPGGGKAVYVGSSNGKLYALDARTGRRRWSFDTTRRSPVLRDRNDLNASPALGKRGVYIGSESGYLWYVPYDYCLHHRDRRCEVSGRAEFGPDLTRLFPVTPGGTTLTGHGRRAEQRAGAATTLTGRLVVRRHGTTRDAAIQPIPSASSLVHSTPRFDSAVELSGDGHNIFVVPHGFLRPGTDYRVRIGGTYTRNGVSVGNHHVGATGAGTFSDTIRLHTRRPRGPLPLSAGRQSVRAFDLRRLAVPLPPFLPSVNQIGFDSYDWSVGTVHVSPPNRRGEGSLLMWVIGARHNARGREVADPNSEFAFPLAGTYRRDSIILADHGVTLTFSFGPVPIQRLEFRAQLRPNLQAIPDPSLYAEIICADVPNYGPFLPVTGLCNDEGKLVAGGTFLTNRYDPSGPANKRPDGLRVSSVDLQRPRAAQDGHATATLSLARGARYRARSHVLSIMLTDASTGEPVLLDYKHDTSIATDGHGNPSRISLEIPKGTRLPAQVRAYVLADVFPLASRRL